MKIPSTLLDLVEQVLVDRLGPKDIEEIDLAQFATNNAGLTLAAIKAAERGAHLRLVVKLTWSWTSEEGIFCVTKMLEGGIEVRRNRNEMHCKTLIIHSSNKRYLEGGSANWTPCCFSRERGGQPRGSW
jgi:hypothetical protein